MGAAASALKGDDPFSIGTSAVSSGVGSALGYGSGKIISNGWNQYGLWKSGGWDPKYNPKLQGGAIKGEFGLSKDMKPHPLPGVVGNMGAAFTTEITNSLIQSEIKEAQGNVNKISGTVGNMESTGTTGVTNTSIQEGIKHVKEEDSE
ncbi:hypothetical protein [Xenorhabdus griffiniae]|uniref:Adhesin n=1 Tax=Xenorhabdus griffiniae TaxID=351672 RepID=A0ABY9XMS9_9GAMM|nr:hypothetical protein [Xenorhabdus griffiniae]MBD1226994.1 hypothetical protein [Xenorhabdus griffiniae]MBE8586122.1 hypothetical protein [Xenorhabdus griffiniae]WMV74225.1 hypothetical protein QL128_09660 [Xenorhabdus griffiniae]WNH03905.1 hypothetical protein QL112_009665 [Xenorhabdus griffiniae]